MRGARQGEEYARTESDRVPSVRQRRSYHLIGMPLSGDTLQGGAKVSLFVKRLIVCGTVTGCCTHRQFEIDRGSQGWHPLLGGAAPW